MAIQLSGDGIITVDGTASTQGRVRLAEDTDNGSNYIELTAPASVASNRTVTMPDASTTLVGTDTVDTLTNKTLTSPTLTTPVIDSATISTVSGSAPLFFCRAWVNFNGTSTVAIRSSGSVSSITDLGTGDYQVNFTTAMPDANYAIAGTQQTDGFFSWNTATTPTTSLFRTRTMTDTGAGVDVSFISILVAR